jgi:hypothetical protein
VFVGQTLIGEGNKAMTDQAGRKNRPGADSNSQMIFLGGVPIYCYLNKHPETGRVEVVKKMPLGVPDKLLKDFDNAESAWAWVRDEYQLRRLP